LSLPYLLSIIVFLLFISSLLLFIDVASDDSLLDAFGHCVPRGIDRNTIGPKIINFARELQLKVSAHFKHTIISLQMDGGRC
jgi:hypothetical protein